MGTIAPNIMEPPMYALNIPFSVLQLHRFASDNVSRENLMWVELACSAGGDVQAHATDGHRLTRVSYLGAEKDGFGRYVGALYVSAATLKAAAKSIKPNRNVAGDAWLTFGDSDTHAALSYGGTTATVVLAAPGEVSYPKVDNVIPGKVVPTLDKPIGVDPLYVVDAMQHATKYVLGRLQSVALDVDRWADDLSPLHLTAVGDDVTATYILMPMRL